MTRPAIQRRIVARWVTWPDNAHLALYRGDRGEQPVILDTPPTALVTHAEAIILGWWQRSRPRPIGRSFHTVTP